VAYLIDGNNFLGRTIPPVHRDPQHRYDLARRLLIFQRLTRSRVILVFDGPPDPKLVEAEAPGGKFSVLFPPRGETADTVIKDLLASLKDLRRFFLVSSDRELRAFARSRGARVLTCAEFNVMLKEAVKRNRRAREMTKTTEEPSPLEVDLWSEVFTRK
jgi:predicted RNA-binding protein with PIN domain